MDVSGVMRERLVVGGYISTDSKKCLFENGRLITTRNCNPRTKSDKQQLLRASKQEKRQGLEGEIQCDTD